MYMLKNAGMMILSLLLTVMLLRSRKRMDSKTAAVHNTQQSEILAAVFQAAFTGATRYDGMAPVPVGFQNQGCSHVTQHKQIPPERTQLGFIIHSISN